MFSSPGLHKQFSDFCCSPFHNLLLRELIPGIGSLGLNGEGADPFGLCLPAPALPLLLSFLPGLLEQSLESIWVRFLGPELVN